MVVLPHGVTWRAAKNGRESQNICVRRRSRPIEGCLVGYVGRWNGFVLVWYGEEELALLAEGCEQDMFFTYVPSLDCSLNSITGSLVICSETTPQRNALLEETVSYRDGHLRKSTSREL